MSDVRCVILSLQIMVRAVVKVKNSFTFDRCTTSPLYGHDEKEPKCGASWYIISGDKSEPVTIRTMLKRKYLSITDSYSNGRYSDNISICDVFDTNSLQF